jgi:transcriptional regulator with XRE-family HTH domain/tetratricopeptide (TPR) repeat protein
MGIVLRLYRRYTGSSQTQVGMALGIPQPHVSDIERGHRRVLTLEMIERFARGLSIPRHLVGLAAELPESAQPTLPEAAADLLNPPDGSSRTSYRRPGADATTDELPALTPVSPAYGGLPVVYGTAPAPQLSSPGIDEYSVLAPAGLRAPEAEAYELMEMVRRTERTDVGPNTVESLHAVVDRLCRDYPTVPAPLLISRTKPRLAYVLRLLDGRMRLTEHRELLVVAGWLSVLLGCLHNDVGNTVAAAAARDAAYHFGKEAGHNEIMVWSYELQAWFALHERRYSDVISASRAGRGLGSDGWGPVQLAFQEARGWARMGDAAETETALERGRAEMDLLPIPEHPEHHFVFDPTKYVFYAAGCYQRLGDHARAEEYGRLVVEQCHNQDGSVRWPMRLADTYIGMGLMAARQGDLDRAVDSGLRALEFDRISGPSLFDVAKDLEKVLGERFGGEQRTAEFHDRLVAVRRAQENLV